MRLRRNNVNYAEGDEIIPLNWPKQLIEDYARKVAETAKFAPGDDLVEIVERLKGNITLQHIDEWIDESGSIFVHGENDFDIALPHYTSPMRDRFTIAHELGHYFLHSNQGRIPIIAYRSGSGRLEWEANWFAASLLMPSDKFKEYVGQGMDLYGLAAKFQVSLDAIRVRKDSVGV